MTTKNKKYSEAEQKQQRAFLNYWAEPDQIFFVPKVTLWKRDPNALPADRLSIGYLPVYEDEESAAEEWPGCEIEPLMLLSVDQH